MPTESLLPSACELKGEELGSDHADERFSLRSRAPCDAWCPWSAASSDEDKILTIELHDEASLSARGCEEGVQCARLLTTQTRQPASDCTISTKPNGRLQNTRCQD